MDLVTELIDLRDKKGVSQATVAAAIGCDQSAISHWEKRKTSPSGSARILLESYLATLRKMPDLVSTEGKAA